MDSIEVSNMVSRGAGIEKRGRRGFGKQIASSDTNLKNRVL